MYIDLFEKIDEAIQEELQNSCDRFDTGIDIISVRVSKPTIPKEVKDNYVNMEAERTKLLVATQHQLVRISFFSVVFDSISLLLGAILFPF